MSEADSATAMGRALTGVFGFEQLRPGQAEVLEDVMAGRPVVGVMPTGAGKSLCYQLPAVVLGGKGQVTLVVSPLIALMKDQVDGLRRLGVRAAQLTSACSAEEQREVIDELRQGRLSLIYVAPERFRSPRFREALASLEGRLGLLAIDEAHCISEWGHDFRPDYRRLGAVIAELRPPRLVALTATATPEVRADIVELLGVDGAALHVRGFARPQLRFAVHHSGGLKDKCRRLEELVRTSDGLALVYAATRKNAEAYAEHLGSSGFRARVYHAGLDGVDRHRAQDEFMDGDIDVIVATNAFGMGVDKSDIRLVVHADLPRSPEAYYQEAGRGGRDGAGADCVLLFNHADVKLQEFLIEASNPGPELLRGLWKVVRDNPGVAPEADTLARLVCEYLDIARPPSRATVDSAIRLLCRTGFVCEGLDGLQANRPVAGEYPDLDPDALERRAGAERSKLACMVEYAYALSCRQRYLLEYFGDEAMESRDWSCGTCDVCTGRAELEQASSTSVAVAEKLLAICGELDGRLGRSRLVAVARGKEDSERFIDCPGYGSLSNHSGDELKELLRALEAAGYLERSRGEYPTIAVSGRGRRVIAGIDELEAFGLRAGSKKRAARASGPVDEELRARLRDLRSELASEHGVPAYRVFSNKTLDAISSAKPEDLDALGRVPGIGPSRLDAFGAEILRVVGG